MGPDPTLLGLVDAGIGIKTGVNMLDSKNRIGTYFAPSHVFIDQNFISTQSDREITNGVAEIVKMGIACNSELLDLIFSQRTFFPQCMREINCVSEKIIRLSVDEMLDELEPNFWEMELCRAVDFGHTFSPKLELWPGADLLHGEAVAIDMALSLCIANGRQYLRSDESLKIVRLMNSIGLPVFHRACKAELLWNALEDAKLHRDGRQRVPIPVKIGQVAFVDDINFAEVTAAVDLLRNLSGYYPDHGD